MTTERKKENIQVWQPKVAQSAGAAECADCISAAG